jgi:hypothetical protein
MNLYEQHPYWLMKNGIVAQYPSLDKDLSRYAAYLVPVQAQLSRQSACNCDKV